MNCEHLKQITDVLNEGDGKFFLVENDKVFVVMTLGHYKGIKNPSELEILDKINDDIEFWKQLREDEDLEDEGFDENEFDEDEECGDEFEYDTEFDECECGGRQKDAITIENI
ncbi:MAG: hypothetical protein V1698_02395 [bacterium]